MTTLGDKALLISRNITELLSANFHYDQLLWDDTRKADDLAVMKGCSERIKKAAAEIEAEVRMIEARYMK